MLERFLERNYTSLKNAADQVMQALNSDESNPTNLSSPAAEAKEFQFEQSVPAQIAISVR